MLRMITILVLVLVLLAVLWLLYQGSMSLRPRDETYSLQRFGGWMVSKPPFTESALNKAGVDFLIIQLFPNEDLTSAPVSFPEYNQPGLRQDLVLSPLDHDVEFHATQPGASQAILSLARKTYPAVRGMYFSVAYASLMSVVTDLISKIHELDPAQHFILRLPRTLFSSPSVMSTALSGRAYIDILVPAFSISHPSRQVCDPQEENGWSLIERWLSVVRLIVPPERLYLGFPGFVQVHEGHQANFRCGNSRIVDVSSMASWTGLSQYRTWNAKELSWVYDIPQGVQTPLGDKGYWVMYDDARSFRLKIARAQEQFGIRKVCFYTLDSFHGSDLLAEISSK